MVIKLYKTSSEKNRINKTITDEIVLNGYLREQCSVTNPVIKIEQSVNLSLYNYAYIEDFGRYYYITDIKTLRNNLWELSLDIDVLMTYKNDILNTVGLINHADLNQYLHDTNIVTSSKCTKQIVTFTKSLPTDVDYLLIVAGGNK
jgi:hypothetical protein